MIEPGDKVMVISGDYVGVGGTVIRSAFGPDYWWIEADGFGAQFVVHGADLAVRN